MKMRARDLPSRRSAIVGRAIGESARIGGVDRDVANAARASSRGDLGARSRGGARVVEGARRLPRIVVPPGVDFIREGFARASQGRRAEDAPECRRSWQPF